MTRADEVISASGSDAHAFVDEVKKRIVAMSADEVEELIASFDYGAGEALSRNQEDLDEEMLHAPCDNTMLQSQTAAEKGDSVVVALLKQFATSAVEDGTQAQDHAEELVASARWDLGGLQDALAAIPAYKDRKTYLRAMAHKVRPCAGNIFYRRNLRLKTAAQDIFAYFTEAANWLLHYRDSFAPSEVAALLRKPKSTLKMILAHVAWTIEFLKIGRRDMDVTMLPDYFWTEVLPRVNLIVHLFEQLSKLKGCEVLRARGMVPAQDVFDRLEYLQAQRKRIGEEMLQKQEADRVEADAQPTCGFVLPVRPGLAGCD